MARVLVTGVTGQIGSYLAELLLADGHEILGIVGPGAAPLPRGVALARGSLADAPALLGDNGALDAVVHLAARTSVARSWSEPLATFDDNARLTAALAYAVPAHPGLRLVHASSAEIFGSTSAPTQDEATPLAPASPYGAAKAAAHLAVKVVREGFGAHATNVIFYLGESPRRAPHFVFRKITRTVAAIARGQASELVLGDTSVVRDFCHARDLGRAIVTALFRAPAGDYVCASGQGRSILDVARLACGIAGVDAGLVRSDPALVRPNDVHSLVGDSRKLRGFGWSPETSFEELVREVYAHDLATPTHEG